MTELILKTKSHAYQFLLIVPMQFQIRLLSAEFDINPVLLFK